MEYHEGPRGQKPEEEQNEEYSFMQETIKDDAGSRKKTKNLILKYIGLGLIFGLAASLSFYALKPWVETRFPGNSEKVTIPEEEEEEEDPDGGEQTAEDTPPPVLTIENYREMNKALCDVGNEVNRCVAEITAVNGEQGWHEASYDMKNSVSGVIVWDNAQEVLVLAKSAILKDTDTLRVSFVDGKSYHAELKKKDENMGLAVFSVSKSELQESTGNQIKTAVLGSSNAIGKGDIMIALGKPFGYAGGMGFGIASSSKQFIEKADGEYRIVCTDIAGTENGTGILANVEGEVIGIIDQAIAQGDGMNLVTAYGISDIKPLIEMLSNGEAVPYIGITGVTVTADIADSQGMPQGVYVQEVKADSPAMAAGIQSGDIITSLNKEEITTLTAYHTELMGLSAGREIKVKGWRQGAGGYVDIDFNVTVGSRE